VDEPIQNDQGVIVGRQIVRRDQAQIIKVELDCGECTCGGEFSATVTAWNYPIPPNGKFTAWSGLSTTLIVHCAGPGCSNSIRTRSAASYPLLRGELHVALSDEQEEAWRAGKPVVLDPKKGILV